MNKPRVIVHNTASVDGRITLAPGALLLFGDERWEAVAGSSNEAYETLKSVFQPDAILEGSGSFVAEGTESPPLPPADGDASALYQDFLPEAVVNRPGHRGWFTVVDGRGRVRWFYKEYPGEEWAGWHLLVLAGQHTPPAYLAYLRRENIPYLVAGRGRVDLDLALSKLNRMLGVQRVLSTAGGRLNGALLRAGLVDEISIELFPAVIGGPDTPSLFDAPALEPNEWPVRLKLISAQAQADDHVWLRYECHAVGTEIG
jgi:riboflavin biosynthesis pyrimidine reductase